MNKIVKVYGRLENKPTRDSSKNKNNFRLWTVNVKCK